LRNGRLNQAAYSLFLFMRDVADGDFVGWIDRRLADADLASSPDRPARLRQAVVEPLTHAYGVSNKVLSMAFAGFLLAGDARRALWIEAGAVMIAVDTLVHNFLHRTGILVRLGAGHLPRAANRTTPGCRGDEWRSEHHAWPSRGRAGRSGEGRRRSGRSAGPAGSPDRAR
jgi:hypothetical protein